MAFHFWNLVFYLLSSANLQPVNCNYYSIGLKRVGYSTCINW